MGCAATKEARKTAMKPPPPREIVEAGRGHSTAEDNRSGMTFKLDEPSMINANPPEINGWARNDQQPIAIPVPPPIPPIPPFAEDNYAIVGIQHPADDMIDRTLIGTPIEVHKTKLVANLAHPS